MKVKSGAMPRCLLVIEPSAAFFFAFKCRVATVSPPATPPLDLLFTVQSFIPSRGNGIEEPSQAPIQSSQPFPFLCCVSINRPFEIIIVIGVIFFTAVIVDVAARRTLGKCFGG